MISLKMKKKSLRSTFFILPSFLDKKNFVTIMFILDFNTYLLVTCIFYDKS